MLTRNIFIWGCVLWNCLFTIFLSLALPWPPRRTWLLKGAFWNPYRAGSTHWPVSFLLHDCRAVYRKPHGGVIGLKTNNCCFFRNQCSWKSFLFFFPWKNASIRISTGVIAVTEQSHRITFLHIWLPQIVFQLSTVSSSESTCGREETLSSLALWLASAPFSSSFMHFTKKPG